MNRDGNHLIGTPDYAKKRLLFISTMLGIGLLFYAAISEMLVWTMRFLIRYSPIGAPLSSFFSSQAGIWLLNLTLGIIAGVCTIALLQRLLSIPVRSFFKKPHDGISITVEGSVWFVSANYIFAYLTSFIIVIITLFTGHKPYAPNFSVSLNNHWAILFNFLYAVVVAPVIEEIVFRGYVLRSLQKFGNVFAIFVSSALFGIWHGNLSQAMPIVLSSVVFGYMAIKSNSIIPCIIAHSFNNFFGTVMDLISQNTSHFVFNIVYGSMIMIFMALSICFLFLRGVSHIRIYDMNQSGLSAAKRTGLFFVSPAMILFLLYIVYEFYQGIF